ncbi:hypothetical protein B9Q12_01720 [Candidatus Marsarchaeota G2 archaeon ECH_B_SAG-G06]|uniref:Uncharacterized protein n=1 Tax=Candidatus Marsarchaeota G2 archaeon ECH_B_SAG-G06 TaxID=1978166 RepID=A0A2R6C1W7_9ARCH|nr:MAG: hypothetical protein B9Q12_01720 [Candidatus Marsarchaeota G2 archaeon ECH_B_SAG-G06]
MNALWFVVNMAKKHSVGEAFENTEGGERRKAREGGGCCCCAEEEGEEEEWSVGGEHEESGFTS